MADQFIGEIRIFSYWGNLPTGWVWCDGQLLSSTTYAGLYAVIGTTYGGNSASFAVPDLRGRAPMHPGQGPGLAPHDLGELGGVESVTLDESQLPQHSHALGASSSPGDATTPSSAMVLAAAASGSAYRDGGTLTPMGDILAASGGGQPHNNMQPYLVLHFAIAHQGIVPPRT